jgi:hypothetical protein
MPNKRHKKPFVPRRNASNKNPRMWGKLRVRLTQDAVLQIIQVYVGSNRSWGLTSGKGVWHYTILLQCTGNLYVNFTHFLFDTYAVSARKKQLFSFIAFPISVLRIRPHGEICCLPPFVTLVNLPNRYFPRHSRANSTKKKQIPIKRALTLT